MEPLPTWFADADTALEAFESAWDSGAPPDLVEYSRRVKPQHRRATLGELIEIDLERRWRGDSSVVRRSMQQYQRLLGDQFPESELVSLICSEYAARNQWGDCVTRPPLYRRYEHLGRKLLRALKEKSAELVWPTVAITEGETVSQEASLDRPIEVGRQCVDERGPWAIRTNFLRHRFVLGEYTDSDMSRRQFSLSLVSPTTVLVENLSKNRPVDIRGKSPVLPGERIRLNVPFLIRIGTTRYLRVCEGEPS